MGGSPGLLLVMGGDYLLSEGFAFKSQHQIQGIFFTFRLKKMCFVLRKQKMKTYGQYKKIKYPFN